MAGKQKIYIYNLLYIVFLLSACQPYFTPLLIVLNFAQISFSDPIISLYKKLYQQVCKL